MVLMYTCSYSYFVHMVHAYGYVHCSAWILQHMHGMYIHTIYAIKNCYGQAQPTDLTQSQASCPIAMREHKHDKFTHTSSWPWLHLSHLGHWKLISCSQLYTAVQVLQVHGRILLRWHDRHAVLAVHCNSIMMSRSLA